MSDIALIDVTLLHSYIASKIPVYQKTYITYSQLPFYRRNAMNQHTCYTTGSVCKDCEPLVV